MTDDGKTWHVSEEQLRDNIVTLHSSFQWTSIETVQEEDGTLVQMRCHVPDYFTLTPKS